MQLPSRKRVFKIPFESFETRKRDPRKGRSLFLENIDFDIIESHNHASRKPAALNRTPRLPQDVSRSRLARTRISGNPGRSETGVASGRLPLKSPRPLGGKPATLRESLLRKEASSHIVRDAIFQREHLTSQFASILIGKGHMNRRKDPIPSARKFQLNTAESHRLPQAERLALFHALLMEPVAFMELHGRFGVSRQAVRGLVKNGLLVETWGPKAVGVRFKLSNKGKTYLRELEAVTKYEPRIKRKDIVQLKHMAYP